MSPESSSDVTAGTVLVVDYHVGVHLVADGAAAALSDGDLERLIGEMRIRLAGEAERIVGEIFGSEAAATVTL